MNSQNINLIEIHNLKKYFPIRGGLFNKKIGDVKAVEKINFTIKKGDVLGLVGESGSGKTTLGRSILRLIEPSEGKIIFENIDITSLPDKEMRKFRKDMQIIFQDPFASLDPRKRVVNIIGQGLKIHTNLKKNEIKETVLNLLEQVDLQAEHLTRYPHEFSGGQRQRIGIARAIALKPKFIVADEPVSALDVSIQAQILNLLLDLKEQYLLTMLFISHDLSVVKYVADKVMVMYLGKVVEIADADKLYSSPLHPYTISLLEITPTINPKHKRSRNILKGDMPSPINPPSGCVFRTRCPKADSECAKIVPELRELKDNHFVACIKK